MTDAPTTPDPIEIAMEAEAHDAAADSPARRVLLKHEQLIGADLQHRRWQIASERAGFVLKVLTGAAAVAAALLVAVVAWQASRAEGLVIQPFSVPPELAQRGVTGDTVAHELLDRLTAIGEVARASEAPTKLAANWGRNISIEIPKTGVSLDQVEQWLRARLGHQRLVTGDVAASPDGALTLVVRLGGAATPVQTGGPGDLAAMLDRTAEAIYRHEQPFSYIQYLTRSRRVSETLEVAREAMVYGDRATRARAWRAYGNGLLALQGSAPARLAFRRAYETDPWADPYIASALADREQELGHVEAEFQLRRVALEAARRNRVQSADARRTAELVVQQAIAFRLRDPVADLAAAQGFAESRAEGSSARLGERRAMLARAIARTHRITAAWAERGEVGLTMGGFFDAPMIQGQPDMEGAGRPDVAAGGLRSSEVAHAGDHEPPGFPYDIASAAEDWATAAVACDRWFPLLETLPDHGVDFHALHGDCGRVYALAGRLADAERVLAGQPADCVPCVLGQAVLAEAKRDHGRADRLFAAASSMAPSLPGADYLFARLLLVRGQPDRALERLAEAVRRSPKFADAISMTGEALLAKGDAKAAAAHFGEAATMVPQWGRLHLKWGEALAKLGKADQARAQWRQAAGMDLTAAERAELQGLLRTS